MGSTQLIHAILLIASVLVQRIGTGDPLTCVKEDSTSAWRNLHTPFNDSYSFELEGSYGVGYSDAHYPGSRSDATSSFVLSTYFLFGGLGYGHLLAHDLCVLGDFWGFSTISEMWKFIGEDIESTCEFSSSYTGNAYPSSRYGAQSISGEDNKMLLFGGWNYHLDQGFYLGDLWEYNTETAQWRVLETSSIQRGGSFNGSYGDSFHADNFPGARSHHTLAKAGDSMFLFGGIGHGGYGFCNTLGDLWEYDLQTGLWRSIGGEDFQSECCFLGTYGSEFHVDNHPNARARASLITYGDSLYLFGGYRAGTDGSYKLGDLWEFSLDLEQWRVVFSSTDAGTFTPNTPGSYETPTLYPGSRWGHKAWTFMSSMYIYGGFGYASQTDVTGYLGDLWEFDLETEQWSVYLAVGELKEVDVTSSRDMDEYSILNFPSARASMTVATMDESRDSILMFGGYDGSATRGGLWELDLCFLDCGDSCPGIQNDCTHKDDGGEWVCQCRTGYSDDTCSSFYCFDLLYTSEDACSSHGECYGPDVCRCSIGYEGTQCEYPVCYEQSLYTYTSSEICNGRGSCDSPNTCTCTEIWEGDQCATCKCVNGECPSDQFDACDCESGWTGQLCDRFECVDPSCATNAECTAPNTCTCKTGWSDEPKCYTPICDPICLNAGVCTAPDVCHCANGWKGQICNEPVCSVCENGNCVAPFTCDCESGWDGNGCDEPICAQECQNGGSCGSVDTCHCAGTWGGPTCTDDFGLCCHFGQGVLFQHSTKGTLCLLFQQGDSVDDTCSAAYEQSKFLEVDDDETSAFLVSLMGDMRCGHSIPNGELRLSLIDAYKSNGYHTWKWKNTGDSPTYTNWAPTQPSYPDGVFNDFCVDVDSSGLWSASNCDVGAGTWSFCQYSPLVCGGEYENTDSVCSSHGDCTSNGCVCESGYFGELCSEFTCFGIVNSSPSVCSANGVCTDPDVCICTDPFEYSGERCEIYDGKCFGVSSYVDGIENYRIFEESFISKHLERWDESEMGDYNVLLTQSSCGVLDEGNAVAFVSPDQRQLTTTDIENPYVDDYPLFSLSFWFVIDRSGYDNCGGATKSSIDSTHDVNVYVVHGDDERRIMALSYDTNEPKLFSRTFRTIAPFQLRWRQEEFSGGRNVWALDSVVLERVVSLCSGNGACTANNTCSCFPEYSGELCDLWDCCSGNGECVYEDGEHVDCICNEGFIGDYCETWTCFEWGNNWTESCGIHGECTALNECSCESGYSGVDCSEWSCFGISVQSDEVCSTHGSCIAQDVCSCDSSYSGSECSEWSCFGVLNSDPNVCEGQGSGRFCSDVDTCVADTSTTEPDSGDSAFVGAWGMKRNWGFFCCILLISVVYLFW